jgi:hypothetical protein
MNVQFVLQILPTLVQVQIFLLQKICHLGNFFYKRLLTLGSLQQRAHATCCFEERTKVW